MSKTPDPWPNLPDTLREFRGRLEALERRSPFFGTGMRPNGMGGIDSDNFAEGSAGYRFSDTGNAEFNDLTLRGGIIGNDALANPVSFASDGTGTSGASLSTTSTVKATETLTVPEGFTIAHVRATAVAMAVNSTAALDYLYCDANIDGVTGGESYIAVPSGAGSSCVGVLQRTLTVTGGDIITATVMARTSAAGWAANAANQFNIHVEATFLR